MKSKKLAGTRELAERLGVSRQYMWRLTTEPGFPKPVHDLYMGQVWDVRAVTAWLIKNRPFVAGKKVRKVL